VIAEERNEHSLLRQPEISDSADVQEYIARRGDESNKATKVDGKEELLQKKLREAAKLQSEIDKLHDELGTPQQILVRAHLLEVSLTKLRRLGVELSRPSGETVSINSVESLQKFLTAGEAAPKRATSTSPPAADVKGIIDLLVANHVAKSITNPTLVSVSGRPVCSFVGEELPLPPKGQSDSAVEYQKCGTELDVLTVLLPNSHVRMNVRLRVSERETSNTVNVGGSTVPALQVRSIDTVVETKIGQPVVLNGLVTANVEHAKVGGQVRAETNHVALLLVVTPELVDSATNLTGAKHETVR
jgi:Flp pilus assembly secretin CpaC